MIFLKGPCQNLTCFPPDVKCFGHCDQGVVTVPLMVQEKILQQPVDFLNLENFYSDFGTDFIRTATKRQQPFFLYYASHVSQQPHPHLHVSSLTRTAWHTCQYIKRFKIVLIYVVAFYVYWTVLIPWLSHTIVSSYNGWVLIFMLFRFFTAHNESFMIYKRGICRLLQCKFWGKFVNKVIKIRKQYAVQPYYQLHHRMHISHILWLYKAHRITKPHSQQDLESHEVFYTRGWNFLMLDFVFVMSECCNLNVVTVTAGNTTVQLMWCKKLVSGKKKCFSWK